jgi:hypothetical protein
MRWWKVIGAAAFVGVAATGVLIARHERRHQDYTPEEIREKLHARAAEALDDEPAALDLDVVGADDTSAEPEAAPGQAG